MDEALRRAYLAAMDIPLWIPRGEEDPFAAVERVVESAVARGEPARPPSPAAAPPAARPDPGRPGRGQAMLAEPAARPAMVPPRPASAAVGATAPAFSVGFVRCGSTLLIDDRALTRGAVDLAGAIAFLLERRRQAVESQDFSWPPRGAPFVAAEARDAVLARIDKLGGAGLKRLVLLGESAACLLLGWDPARWATRPVALERIEGLDCVVSLLPAAAQMLQSPDAKRLAWQNLQLVPRDDA